MPINPAEISTIRTGELPIGAITVDSILAVENDTELEQITGQELIDFVNTNANTFQFEVKDLWVGQDFIDDNFNGSGLGIELMVGYAICNGNNGTPDLDGLVSIGYGTNYSVAKAVGGSKDAVVVAHTHVVALNGGAGGSGNITFDDGTGTPHNYTTNSTGVSGTNKNMQPYMVLLKIMKL